MGSETISLVVDASESAASVWKETAQATANLLEALPQGAVEGIYLLGSATRWEAAQWQKDMPFPVAACKGSSFIAPSCSSWQQRRSSPSAVAIIGAGEIFDLLDWAGSGAQWVLLRTGEASLQGAQGRLPELLPAELEQAATMLGSAVYPFQPPRAPRLTGSVAQQWRTDRAGFPMVWVPPLEAFVQLFPILKAQFECFLTQTDLPEFGDQWYQKLLTFNPRLPLSAPTFGEYERLCLTGLLPEEVAAFAAWQGPGFRSLTLSEWQVATTWMAQQGLPAPPADIEAAMALAARRIWQGLLTALQPQRLDELALLHNGVVEWVIEPNGVPQGMGRPRQRFQPGFARSPWIPTAPPRRAKIWGGRLLTTEA
jgi:hypothetical protein